MKRFKNTYMFISAIKSGLNKPQADSTATSKVQHWPLWPQTLLRLQKRGFSPSCPYLFRSTLFSSWKAGILLGILNFGQRAPSSSWFVCFFFLFILMPTVMSPLYYRHVLNSLHLFFVFVFYFFLVFWKTSKRKKEIRWLPHVCPPPANVKFPEQTGCHFTTSATFSALLFCLSVLGAIWNRRAGVEITSEHLWVIPEWDILHC